MAQFTSSTTNITIGDTNDTVKLNRIFPLYTSIPSAFDLNYIGGKFDGTNIHANTQTIGTTGVCMFKFDNVPVGQYIVSILFEVGANNSNPTFRVKVSDTSGNVTTPYSFVGLHYDVGSSNGARDVQISPIYVNTTSGSVYVSIKTDSNSIAVKEKNAYLIRIG